MSPEEMKALVNHVMDEMFAGNLAVLDEHPGMQEVIPMVQASLEVSTDVRHEIAQQLVDGDWVVTRLLRSFVQTQDFMGGQAGEHIQLEIITLCQIQDGVIVKQHSQAGRIG